MPSDVAGARARSRRQGGFRSRGQRSMGPNGAGFTFPGPVSRGHLADAGIETRALEKETRWQSLPSPR